MSVKTINCPCSFPFSTAAADAATSVQRFVSVFVGVYILLILAYAFLVTFQAYYLLEKIGDRVWAADLVLGAAEHNARVLQRAPDRFIRRRYGGLLHVD
mgnify:CR=1 FL=1